MLVYGEPVSLSKCVSFSLCLSNTNHLSRTYPRAHTQTHYHTDTHAHTHLKTQPPLVFQTADRLKVDGLSREKGLDDLVEAHTHTLTRTHTHTHLVDKTIAPLLPSCNVIWDQTDRQVY